MFEMPLKCKNFETELIITLFLYEKLGPKFWARYSSLCYVIRTM
jgi:hypothetical protein